MERKIPANKTNSYTTMQDYFLAHWVNTIGLGPAMFYLQLLSYCHKYKDIVWPSNQTTDKKSIDKIILNYSLEDIEEKILLQKIEKEDLIYH